MNSVNKLLVICFTCVIICTPLCSCQELSAGGESCGDSTEATSIYEEDASSFSESIVPSSDGSNALSVDDNSIQEVSGAGQADVSEVSESESSQSEESMPEDGEYMTVKECDDGNCLLVCRRKADGRTQYAASFGGNIIYELEPGITVDNIGIIKPSEVYEFEWSGYTEGKDLVMFDYTGKVLVPAGMFDLLHFYHTETKCLPYGTLRYKESQLWVISDLYGNIISDEFYYLDQHSETFFLGTDINNNEIRVFIDEETDKVTVTDYNLEDEIKEYGDEIFKPITELFTAIKNDDRDKMRYLLDEECYNQIIALLETVDKDDNPENLQNNELMAWFILNHESVSIPGGAHEWVYINVEEGLVSMCDFYAHAYDDKYMMWMTASFISDGKGNYMIYWVG